MSLNLIDLFKEQLTDGVLDKVSGLVGGGDSGAIQKGLMAAAPALLGGIMDKASSSSEGAASIFDMLGDGSALSNLGAGGDTLSQGSDLVGAILGDKASGVIDMVSSVSGIGKDSSSSLLSVAGSLVGGVLGQQKSSGLDLGSFVSLLSSQGSIIEKFAPAGLASILGLASFSGLSNKLGDLAGGALGFAGGAADLAGNAGKAALDGAGKIGGAAAGLAGGAANLAGNAGKAALDGAGKIGGAAAGLAGGAANLAGNAGKAALGGAGKIGGAAAGLAGGAANLAGDTAKAGGSLLKKILPIALVLLALLFAFFLIKGCDSDKSLLDNVKGAADQATGTVKGAADSTLGAAGSVVDAAGNVAGSAVDAAGNAVNSTVDAAGNVAGSAVDAAGNAVNAAGNAVGNTVDAAGNAVGAAGSALGNVAGGIKNASGKMVNAFGETIGSFFSWALPNGTKLNIPKGGFEDQLLSYIKGGNFESGKAYAFDRLYFNTGSSALSKESVDQINNVAAILAAYPEVKVLFRGHTDNTGSVAGNNALSGRRASSVKAKLIQKGISASRVATKGMGSVEPIATNATAEGRSKNRRIDVAIVK